MKFHYIEKQRTKLLLNNRYSSAFLLKSNFTFLSREETPRSFASIFQWFPTTSFAFTFWLFDSHVTTFFPFVRINFTLIFEKQVKIEILLQGFSNRQFLDGLDLSDKSYQSETNSKHNALHFNLYRK